MKKFLFTFILFSWLLSACSNQGGSEAGNPPSSGTTRTVQGALTTSSAALRSSFREQTTTCPADTIIATNSSAETTTATIDTDCSFSLSLQINRPYSLSFTREDNFVASMFFNNASSGLASSVFFISSGTTIINLGNIRILDRIGTPENEPARQCDRDGDGSDDFDDDDDDNDGVHDEEEQDCDLDNILDDDDSDTSSCNNDAPSDNASVTRVNPPNNQDLSLQRNLVDLDREVEARFSCSVDETTVTSSTFQIESSLGNLVTCDFEVSDETVKCHHDDDLFTPNLNYTATIDGVKCSSGDDVNSISWTWRTDSD